MSFTFEARTLLELGKELISTDEVAIYELIKNSVDAGSQNVEILVNVLLTHSDFREAIARIEEEGKAWQDVLTYVQSCLIEQTDSTAIRMMESLARAQDALDFTRLLRKLYAELNWIEVRDTGHGMSLHDLKDIFLKIGTRSRRDENLAGSRNLGDKGIGRLSAMRLGDKLRVLSSKAGQTHWNVLDIDWSLFSHDSRKPVEEIKIEPIVGEEKSDASNSGTRIIISTLQSDWTAARFADVLQGRIARMIDPFEPGAANRLLIARFNGQRVSIPSIPRQLLDSAHAYCHVTFEMVGDEPVLTGSVDYRYRHRSIKIDERGASVYSLTQTAIKRRAKRGHAAFSLSPVRPSALRALGRFSCDIYWFNRRVVDAVSGLTEKAAETRREISNWSGGPMLYRYGFRILPYGDPIQRLA